ncbi:arginine--tRNA ligase [Dactylosporangium sp. AC04546]|uniref:arginine--tRNA ligase n=1 Tax=Dactylosporangium sp. AC04546 TaxID=2862460 RepID=UPI001EE0AB79|nr:arginine--tRNA ligase [Dactylosporangium sp. AC04546]WVK85031.1 arginine--tRNA ligase [Dactylosporangium sp. AC04546]
MTPAELAVAVLAAARAAITERDLDASVLPATTSVERPRNPEHGDYASNIALQLGKKVGLNPRDLAAAVAKNLQETPGIDSVEIAGPGFLNIRLSAAAAGALAGLVVRAGSAYGRSETLAKEKVNLEFVSANPTGPVHLGHTRWAAVGDALGRILTAAGADVTREHYINDAGVQMARFGESVMAAANNQPTPPDGYPGEYIQDIAAQIVRENPDILEKSDKEQASAFQQEGYKAMLKEMQDSLERFGVHFDVWFSEKTLHDGGAVEHALDELRKQGHVFESDGAIWLRTTDFGDDKDRVLIRSNGEKTYFAADAAYYINKRERGFERCIYMLGADHHGYIGRLKAIAACAGDDPQRNIEVLIGQLVSLLRGGEPVRLSKRAGTLITLDELIDAVGVDAARYSLARSSTDSPLTLDIEVITRQKNDNPVFYVQYVGARTASIARNAAEFGHTRGEEFDPSLLVHEKELDLLKALGDFPAVVATAAELREPHRVARYLEDLAGAYHRFFDNCRVLPQGDDPFTETNRARLWLNDATRQVIVNGLDLLGVSAPERM